MAKRVNRQLKKQLEEQKNLEEELDKLQNGKNPKESCSDVIKFVQSTSMDPMPDTENNPFVRACFIAGTEILVNKHGKHKKIEELRVGEVIQCLVPTHASFKESIDCETKDIPNVMTDAVVAAIFSSVTYSICSIKYRNLTTNEERTIECTNSHPIYVNKEGWKTVSGISHEMYDFEIQKLKVGDQVCLEGGHLAQIIHIHSSSLKDPVTVYNLTASKGNTYFANGLFVHNKGLCDGCVIL